MVKHLLGRQLEHRGREVLVPDALGPHGIASRRRRIQDEAAGVVGEHRRDLLAPLVQQNDECSLDRRAQHLLDELSADGLCREERRPRGGYRR